MRVCSDTSAINPAVARTEAAAVVGATDLGSPRSIAVGFDAHDVAFDPSGQILAIGGHSSGALGVGNVRLVNVTTDTEVRRLKFPADRSWELTSGGRLDGCWSIAFGPDGKHVAVGTRSGWLVVWDLDRSDPDPIKRWRHVPLPDGTLAAKFDAGIIRLFFDQLGRLWSDDDVTVVSWEPARDWSERSRQKGILCRPAAGQPKPEMAVADEFPTALHPTGRLFIRRERDQELIVCLEDGHPVGRLALPDDDRSDDNIIRSFLVTPDGTALVATAEHAGHLKVWDLVGSRLFVARNMAHGTLRIAMNAQGGLLAVAEDDRVQLFEIIRPLAADAAGFQPYPLDDVDLSPDGRLLATAGTCPHRSAVFDVRVHNLSREPLAEQLLAMSLPPPKGNSRNRIAISPDGKTIVTHQRDAYVRVHPPAAQLEPFEGPPATRDIRFSPSGQLWAAGAETVFTWPNGSDKVAQTDLGVASMVVLNDGGALVGRNDGSIVWYSETGELLRLQRVSASSITALASVGDQLIAGTATGDVLILHGERVVQTISQAHADTIWALAIGPQGWFATGSADRQVRIWAAAGREVFALPQTRPVRRLFWIDEGRTLAIMVEGEQAIRRWHLTELIAEFRKIGIDSGLPDIECPPSRNHLPR